MTRLFAIIAGGSLALAVPIGLEAVLHVMGEECRHWNGDAFQARAFVLRTEPASPSRPFGLQSTIAGEIK